MRAIPRKLARNRGSKSSCDRSIPGPNSPPRIRVCRPRRRGRATRRAGPARSTSWYDILPRTGRETPGRDSASSALLRNHNWESGMIPTITTFGWVPEFARGFVRDMRPRWAFEEVGQPYAVNLISNSKTPEHRRFQLFGQVPTYRDDEVAIFESGAIVLRIAERTGRLIPVDPAPRMRALQWLAAALNSVEPYVMALAINDIFEADREWSKARHVKVVADLRTRLADLEAALGNKVWLDGNEFTVGDLMMISVLGGLRRTAELAAFPLLADYVARGEGRPAHRKAMADHMATFDDAAA